MNDLYLYLNNYIQTNKLDGLFFNSSNEFLVEYNTLNYNSSYKLSNFSGSQSYLIYTKDKMYLFVDSRYHLQAENEIDSSFVQLIKVPLSVSPFDSMIEMIPENFKLGIPATCVSKLFVDKLKERLFVKSSEVIDLPNDIVREYTKSNDYVDITCFKTDINIVGKSFKQKIDDIRKLYNNDFALIVTSLDDCAYISNLRAFDFPYSSSFPMKMIITDSNAFLYSNIEYCDSEDEIECRYLDDFYIDILKIKNKNVFIDKAYISEYDFSLIDTSNTIKHADLSFYKIRKNPQEIEHLKYAFHQSDKSLKIIEDMLNSENIYSEYEYKKALIDSLYDNFANSLSFNPIVAAGSNSAIIHYSLADKSKKVQDGDLLLIDFGAYFEGGYATDTTRTFVKGIPSQEQQKVYTTVLKAFLNAYHKMSKLYFDIDFHARNIIEKELGDEYPFSHSTGHGVGINVHEIPPRLSNSDISKVDIIPNTVFSIEPGAYKQNFGGVRLENTVYAKNTPNGIQLESLSKYKFEDKLIDKSLLNNEELQWLNDWQAEYEKNYISK